jgi:hypothetical protein
VLLLPGKNRFHVPTANFSHFAGLATDAHSWISEETNLNVVAHECVPALIRTVCAFADHGTIGVAITLFLPSRGRRRLCRP